MSEMQMQVTVAGRAYQVDLAGAVSIAIPLTFDGPQPNAFYLPDATSEAVEAGDFVGDTRRGGGANCRNVRLNPHGNGTHTECVGHIVDERVAVGELAIPGFVPATVVSVRPVPAPKCADTYEPEALESDFLVTRASLQEALDKLEPQEGFGQALVIRTRPNSTDKMTQRYSGANPGFLSREAMGWICELGVEHLLIDLPSVDREEDEGLLANHHEFWGVPQGEHTLDGAVPSTKTITEMIYVPDQVDDGRYLLNLQVPRFQQDAAPSRPVVAPLRGG
ncbi:MAG: cyclase family protein [Myxococcota bacterium]